MPPFVKQKVARTHQEALRIVCAACFRKPKEVRPVSDKFEQLICQFVYKDYSKSNGFHPTVVCVGCQKTLSDIAKNPENPKRHLPKTPKYDELKAPGPETRSSSNTQCVCQICVIARMLIGDYKKHVKEQSNPVGAPKIVAISPPGRCLPVCSKCLSIMSKGISHVCTKTMKQQNLANLVKSNSVKSKSKVTSEVLKSICSESGVTLKGGDIMLATGGKPLPVTIGNPPNLLKKPRFTHDSLKRLQAAYNFSDRAIKGIAAAFRVEAGRKSVVSNLSKSLVERNSKLDYLFSTREIIMKERPKEKKNEAESEDEEIVDDSGYKDIPTVGVFCEDCDELVQLVLYERGLDPHACDVHVGFDGGQGILKIGFTVTERNETVTPTERSKYSDGVAPKSAKSSSVKKLLVLGAVPDVPENYSNVKTILDQLNIEAIQFTVSADIKMLMIMVGKSSGSPKHGCPFCSACSPYLENGTLYTLADLLDFHQKFVNSGSNSKTQKNFDNVTNPPLITSPVETQIIEILCVPELHLLLGVVEKLLREFENRVFLNKNTGKKFMDNYLKSVSIVRKSYQGATSLEGNQSRKFLKLIDKLELELMKESEEVIVNGLPYIHTFRAFDRVVSTRFGNTLKEGYQETIEQFKAAYLSLGISVTPKVHIVFQHVSEFLDIVNSGGEKSSFGLGYFSEQAFEAMHSDIKGLWERVKVSSGHPEFGERLKSFIVAYNARHL